MAGAAQAQAAGCCEAGQALADLEACLPPFGSVLCTAWDFWQEWRDSVLSARTAAKLAPQVGPFSKTHCFSLIVTGVQQYDAAI